MSPPSSGIKNEVSKKQVNRRQVGLEALLDFNRTTPHYNPEHHIIDSNRCENMKSSIHCMKLLVALPSTSRKIFQNVLHQANCTNFVTWTINTGIKTVRNISFLSLILELYCEIALCRIPFGIGHMCIYTFLLRMTNTMTSNNIDLSSWNSLCNAYNPVIAFGEGLTA
jgi:hypothetical protein